MKIADSSVYMLSGRQYTQTGTRSGGAYAADFMGTFNSYDRKKDSSARRDTWQKGNNNGGAGGWGGMGSYNMDDIGYFRGLGKITSGSPFEAAASAFQNSTLSAIFKRFASFGMGMTGGAGIGGYSTNTLTYSETEETGFHAGGRACTEDGRTIDFNISILMSRSYMEYFKVNIPAVADALCDPLIVNTGSAAADVRDQTFRFDLDADGIEDEISMLGKGSGFLALDKDENGRIDDGIELFGTKSGDGFADLREYDGDGNGWIDENDEIFSKLKVWCKDEKGRDILMDLKEADIGAIFLGARQTEFFLGGADGYRDGVIRSTGVFLRESAGAGTIQHVDLSLKQNGPGPKVSGDDTVSEVNASGRQSAQGTGDRERAREMENRQRDADRRQEEARRKEETARKKRADARAAKEALDRRRMERREYLEKIQEKQFMERKEYREQLQEYQMARH